MNFKISNQIKSDAKLSSQLINKIHNKNYKTPKVKLYHQLYNLHHRIILRIQTINTAAIFLS